MLMNYEEKVYLLKLLKKNRRSLFQKTPAIHDQLIQKLEQMIRNEEINRGSFGKDL
jgi:ribosomal protein L30/L7E